MVYAGRKYTYNDTAELCRRVRENNDNDAMTIIVRMHDGLVWRVIKDCEYLASPTVSKEDMAQAGRIGLMRAVREFDPEKGSFSTYATWWIFSEIQREAMDLRTTVRIPRSVQEDVLKINRASEKHADKSAKDLVKCVAKDTGLSEGRVTHALKSAYTFRHGVSIDLPVRAENDGFLVEFIPDRVHSIEDDLYMSEVRNWIRDALDRLPDNYRLAIVLRFGLYEGGDEMTYEQVGEILGVCAEQAHKVVTKALRLLRHPRYCGAYDYLRHFSEGVDA